MYARVSTIQGKPQQVGDGIRQYREQVMPAVKKMAGFKGAYFLVDRKSGKEISITLWNTEKDLQASAKAANQLRAQASETVAASNPPTVEIYEVAVQP
jgi:heme-degrading monooxygenase HmoA